MTNEELKRLVELAEKKISGEDPYPWVEINPTPVKLLCEELLEVRAELSLYKGLVELTKDHKIIITYPSPDIFYAAKRFKKNDE